MPSTQATFHSKFTFTVAICSLLSLPFSLTIGLLCTHFIGIRATLVIFTFGICLLTIMPGLLFSRIIRVVVLLGA